MIDVNNFYRNMPSDSFGMFTFLNSQQTPVLLVNDWNADMYAIN